MGIQGGARGRQVATIGSAIAAGLIAVLVVGSMGGSGGAAEDEQEPVLSAAEAAAQAAAQAALQSALDAWKAFPADAKTRPLVVLDDVAGPRGWKTAAAGKKFAAGHWTAPKSLPSAPAKFRGYPVISAADALKVLRAAGSGEAGAKTGAPLRVAAMRLGTAPFATDRGTVRLPAWQVLFDASKGAHWVPAVAAPAAYEHGGAVAGPSATLAGGGKTVTLSFACTAEHTAKVAESAQAVAVRLVRGAAAATACSVPVSLAAPLGDRVLLSLDEAGEVSGPLVVTAAKAAG